MKNFKIKDLDYIKLDYRNKNNLLNKVELKKNKSNFSIKGKSFDATQFINNSMDDDEVLQFLKILILNLILK